MKILQQRKGLHLPRSRATTLNLAALYPWYADDGLGHEGVLIGENADTGVRWCWDPFVAYQRKITSSPNVLIFGQLGSGKSTAIKTYVLRSALLGNGYGGRRWFAIVDPKGEYGALAQALGLRHLRLYPGGPTRLNPLDAGPTVANVDELRIRRTDMITALAAALIRTDPSPTQEAILALAARTVTDAEQAGRSHSPTLKDIIGLLAAPTSEMVSGLGSVDANDFITRGLDIRHALESLTVGRLAGMFDGQSTEPPNWDDNGVVIDVSSVFSDPRPFELVMIATTSWLQSLLATPEGPDVPRRVQVLEEIWALLQSPRVATYYQAAQKLARSYGVANFAVAHRLSDLWSQTADGTAANKIAAGILADTETRILFRQPTDQLDTAVNHLGLSQAQAAQLPTQERGTAIWQLGTHMTRIQHRLASSEADICFTDGALAV